MRDVLRKNKGGGSEVFTTDTSTTSELLVSGIRHGPSRWWSVHLDVVKTIVNRFGGSVLESRTLTGFPESSIDAWWSGPDVRTLLCVVKELRPLHLFPSRGHIGCKIYWV